MGFNVIDSTGSLKGPSAQGWFVITTSGNVKSVPNAHALLDGAVHSDTVAQAVTRGSLIYGNSTPKWDELVVGAANTVVRTDGTDVAWGKVALATDVSGDLPFANLAQITGASVLANATTGTTADVAALNAGADHQVLRRNGTAIAFGAIDISQAAAVGTSRLPFANLASGSALSVLGVSGNAAADHASIPAAQDNYVLRRSGTTLDFGAVNLASTGVSGVLLVANGGSNTGAFITGAVIYAPTGTQLGSTGTFTFASGVLTIPGNIAFPATQLASTGANVLDDYEEGTWTPTDGSGAGLSFSVAVGFYLKIGRLVFISFTVVYPVTADGSNSQINGVPFTVSNQVVLNSLGPGVSTDFYVICPTTGTNAQPSKNSGVRYINSELSGKAVICTGMFLADA